jgi:DNA processing protein
MTDDDLLPLLRLQMTPGVGAQTLRELLRFFGSAAEVWNANSADWLDVPGVGPKTGRAMLESRDSDAAPKELARCRDMGIHLVVRGTPEYPVFLNRIHDPPEMLYVRGDMQPRDQLALAVIGSRQCTMYGRQTAQRLAAGLARAGVTIVSGLARGIDSCAHRGALEGGGRTLAILGTGLGNVYPPENKGLADEVAASGAVISEMPLDQAALPGLFPLRNRIISGLSQGVLVVEAKRNSGAMHTVRHALDQGRDVFAVPGRIDSLASEGCHDLLRDGATLVRGVDDILDVMGPLLHPVATGVDGPSSGRTSAQARGAEESDVAKQAAVRSARELTLGDIERQVLAGVPQEGITIDELLREIPLEPSRVLSTLTILEMKRFVRRLPGGQVCRA